MTETTKSEFQSGIPPVAIGGVGGSGTRVVARILLELGYYMGDDLNGAHDNLWFTLLFKRLEILDTAATDFDGLVEIFVKAMTGSRTFSPEERTLILSLAAHDRSQHPSSWLRMRAETLLSKGERARSSAQRWGWKEPNTHIVIDRLVRSMPELKYVHVVRNGLDMCFSTNQNQVNLWGGKFLGPADGELTPRRSLRYWCETHRRVLELRDRMPERFFLLNFDQLCREPAEALVALLRFIGIDLPENQLQHLSALVSPPASIGRFKLHVLDSLEPTDIEFVDALGFETR